MTKIERSYRNHRKHSTLTITLTLTETNLRGEGNKNWDSALIYHKICGRKP